MDSDIQELDRLIAYVEALPQALRVAAGKGLDDAAKLILQEAKEEIGTLQTEDMGPAEPWATLAPRTVRERVQAGYTPDEPGLRDGTMRDDYERSRVGLHAQVGTANKNAEAFELGTEREGESHQPPRHVLLTAAWRMADKACQAIAARIGKAVEGGRNVR